MKNIKDSLKLFRYNRRRVLLFEGLLLLVSYAVFMPVFYMLFNLSIKWSGLRYITKENIVKYFKSPVLYLFLLIVMVLAAFLFLLNVSGIIYAYDAANEMKRLSPFRILIRGFRNAVRILRPRNWLLIPYMLCLFPVAGIAFASATYLNIGIPPYLQQLLKLSKLSLTVIGAVYVVLSFLVMASIYTIYEFSLKRESFITSVKLGAAAMKKEKFRNFLLIVVWNLAVFLLVIFLNGELLNVLRRLAEKYISSGSAVTAVYSLIDMFNFVTVLLLVLIALPLNFAVISNSYYNLNPNKEGIPNIDSLDYYAFRLSGKKGRRVMAIIIIVALLLDAGYMLLSMKGVLSLNIVRFDTAAVTAHRGAAESTPENTLVAFRKAIDEGADFIELDVRQTQDGEIVVMHDESLKRTCGVKGKVGNKNLDEIKELSAGAWFGKKFRDEKVPTLREALDLIGHDAVINIELKLAKTDKDLTERVIAMVKEYEIEDNVVIACTSSKVLKKVKELAPELKTVYIMQVAWGDFYNMDYVDVYSIKYIYVTREMVRRIHKEGKEVYVWTVDDRKVIEQMMLKDVDNIITNRPKFVRETMASLYEEGTLYDIIQTYVTGQ